MRVIGLQNHDPPALLARDPFRIAVEQVVSERSGRQWVAQAVMDMTEFACHPCALFSDGVYSVFAKLSEAADGLEQFEIELAGLRLLSERAGVLTPTPIGLVAVPSGCILVLETVEAVERAPHHWRQIGQALARIHAIEGEQFGLEIDGYFGPLQQDNRPMADWPSFYAERRLWPGLRLAVDSGNLPPEVGRQVETLISRVPELSGPEIAPTLLHGDAQQNNFISTDSGPVVIDPAVYHGHPEMDLAQIDMFQPVPDDVYDGYQGEHPIDPEFWDRRDLWRVWGYLAAVTVEGPSYLPGLVAAVRRYL